MSRSWWIEPSQSHCHTRLRTIPIRTVTTVVIGAGHAGLAMSRCLSERSIDHVVLERGEVAHTWRTERWDSLRLLTPNWQSRLPGFSYDGGDPDGYRTLAEVIEFIASYADAISAPVLTHTTVTSVRSSGTGYLCGPTKAIGYAGRS
jgi:putative flavoprotein involved in K+ transport